MLFPHFLRKDALAKLGMESIPKNVALMLMFLKGWLLPNLFSSYTFTILRHIFFCTFTYDTIQNCKCDWICRTRLCWLNPNLTLEKIWIKEEKGFSNSILWEQVLFYPSHNSGAINVKVDKSVLCEKPFSLTLEQCTRKLALWLAPWKIFLRML